MRKPRERRERKRSAYGEMLLDPRWQKKRLLILERDGWECTYCGDKTKTLHVHHRRYEWGRKPWEYEDSDLVSLCMDCHETATVGLKRVQSMLGDLDPGDYQKVVGYIVGLIADGKDDSHEIVLEDWAHVLGVSQAWDTSDDRVMQVMRGEGKCSVTVGQLEDLRADAYAARRNDRK